MSSAVGRRYAKALLELAVETKELEKVTRDLEDLAKSWSSSPELEALFENPDIGAPDRKKVIEALSLRMSLSTTTKHFFMLLSDRRRTRYLPDIVAAFRSLAEESTGRVRAEIVTAVAMPESYYAEVQKALEATTGLKITIDKRQDPSIIGGVVTRIGDRVFDGSLKTRLAELEDQLVNR
jgi:F-type H+-transporting ATPase subunit delta